MRITDLNLEELPANIRRQVEPYLATDETRPADCAPSKKRQVGRQEEDAGRALTSWIDALVMPSGLRPGLFWYHVPNGLARTAAMGGIFKAQGLRKGWPDYALDIPAGPYHGFRLELKRTNGPKPSKEQLDILERLESMGYKCAVAWGFDDAKRATQQYLDLVI